MAKGKVTATVEQEIKIAPKVQRQIHQECEIYATMQQDSKKFKVEADAARGRILDIVNAAGIEADGFKIEGFGVAVVRGALDKRLDKTKLLKRLVKDGHYTLKSAQALLADCTTEKPKKDHVRVTAPGEESDDE